jgi:hypothetical protein
MASLIYDAKRWLERAEEVRALAWKITNPDIKRQMHGVADSYLRLAQHTGQAQSVQKNTKSQSDHLS